LLRLGLAGLSQGQIRYYSIVPWVPQQL